jgi:hypothetical protein
MVIQIQNSIIIIFSFSFFEMSTQKREWPLDLPLEAFPASSSRRIVDLIMMPTMLGVLLVGSSGVLSVLRKT